MFGLLQKLGFGDPVREARQLNKDAQDILEMIHNVHGATRLAEIADVIRTARREVQERATGDPTFYKRGVAQLTERNRAARRRNDQVTWSGLTLTIIYLKAEVAGGPATPARAAIDSFLAGWAHGTSEADTGVDDDPPASTPSA